MGCGMRDERTVHFTILHFTILHFTILDFTILHLTIKSSNISMKTAYFTIVLFLCQGLLFSQGVVVPESLKQFVGQSFLKYPKVAEMGEVVKMGEVRVNLGKAGYWPVAGGDLSYRHQYPNPSVQFPIGNGQFQTVNFQPSENYNASVNVAQPLMDLRVSPTVNKAKSDLLTSQDNLESYKIQLAYQVAQVYYAIIFLNKSLTVQQEQINLLKSTLDQIGAKVKNGDALSYDLVSTQVKFTNAENFYTDLATQVSKQYNLLAMLTGNSGAGFVRDTLVQATAFLSPVDSVFALAYRNNPELRVAGDRIKTAEWDIVSAQRLRLPTISLLAGLGFKNGFMPEIDVAKFNYAVGVGIAVPILSASRPGLQKEMATLNVHASKYALESQKLNLQKDLQNSLEDIRKNEKKLASADTLIMQAQLAHQLASDRYKYGVITNLDLLTSLTNYKDAQLSQLQFQYNLLLSRIELCRLAGVKFW